MRSEPGRGRRPDRRLTHMWAAVGPILQKLARTLSQPRIVNDIYGASLALPTGALDRLSTAPNALIPA